MQINDYIRALPDSYDKDPKSNNYKLLLLEHDLVHGFRKDIDVLQDTLDVYNATGKTLDLYGSIYGQVRGKATDEQFRYVILQKAMQCISGTDTNSIIEALSAILRAPKSEFGVSETENPCEVKVTSLPYSILQSAGLTASQMYSLFSGLLPVGVRLAPIELEGTFEFDSKSDIYDEEKGFGNVEQSIGGYLGHLGDDDIDLPI